MIDVQIVPKSVTNTSGAGEAFEIAGAANRVFLVTAEMTRTLEQQSLEVALEWSTDGAAWGRMAVLPQQFYPGSAELALDLTRLPEVKWVRARWELGRWGRGSTQLECEFSVRMRELSADAVKA